MAIVSRRAKVRHMDAEFLRHSGMRDLQSAKHRHSSLQKPMGRFILLADAFLATAHERLSRHQYVAISKKNCVANLRILRVKTNAKPRRVAKKFLESISTEVYLQMAMMANAADEEIRILRRFDKSQMDMSAAQTCLTNLCSKAACALRAENSHLQWLHTARF